MDKPPERDPCTVAGQQLDGKPPSALDRRENCGGGIFDTGTMKRAGPAAILLPDAV